MLVHGVGQQSQAGLTGHGSGFLFGGEVAEVLLLPVDRDERRPLPGRLVPADASVRGRGATMTAIVLHLLPMRHHPEIRPPVVGLVPVDVVNFEPVADGQPHQLAMQEKDVAMPVDLSAAPNVAFPVKPPRPLVDEVGVSGINQGVADDSTITGAQGDTNGILRAHRVPPELGVVPGVGPTTPGLSASSIADDVENLHG